MLQGVCFCSRPCDEDEHIYAKWPDRSHHWSFLWNFRQTILYDHETGLITNRENILVTPHCIAIPNFTNKKKKQQLELAPCDSEDPGQSWIVENGMIKVRRNRDVCIMWNLGDKTRLFSVRCREHVFAPMIHCLPDGVAKCGSCRPGKNLQFGSGQVTSHICVRLARMADFKTKWTETKWKAMKSKSHHTHAKDQNLSFSGRSYWGF